MAEAVPAAERRVTAFLGVVLVVGALVLWVAFDTDRGIERLIGLLGAMGALYALVAYGPYVTGRPLLEADTDGLAARWGLSNLRIPWSQIEFVAVTHYHVAFWRLPMLVVRIRDPRSTAVTLPRRQRRLARRRSVVTHSLLFSALGTEDVLALVERQSRPTFERSEDGLAIIHP